MDDPQHLCQVRKKVKVSKEQQQLTGDIIQSKEQQQLTGDLIQSQKQQEQKYQQRNEHLQCGDESRIRPTKKIV